MTAPGTYTAQVGTDTITVDGLAVTVRDEHGKERLRVSLSEILDVEVAPARRFWAGHLKLVTRRKFPVQPWVYTVNQRETFEELAEAIRYRLRFPQFPTQ